MSLLQKPQDFDLTGAIARQFAELALEQMQVDVPWLPHVEERFDDVRRERGGSRCCYFRLSLIRSRASASALLNATCLK